MTNNILALPVVMDGLLTAPHAPVVAGLLTEPHASVMAGLLTEPRVSTGTVSVFSLLLRDAFETCGRSPCGVRRPADI